jgi:RHS repeat-associated protein
MFTNNILNLYKPNTNQLLQVTDAVSNSPYSDDIENQNANNYTYNKLGQLIANQQDAQTITYNAYGKVKSISTVKVLNGNTYYPSVSFYYDANGYKVRKVEKRPKSGVPNAYFTYTTYYANDIAGNPLSIYTTQHQSIIDKQEIPIYAAGRLGTIRRAINASTYTSEYELNDHLGNVRLVLPRNYNGTNAQTLASYYPFGMNMPGSNHSLIGNTQYRFGYQGQFAEKDPETGLNNFEARMYDARIGRWFSLDEVKRFHSRYLGMGNNPVSFIDKDGRDIIIFQNSKAVGGKGHTALAITNDKGGWTFIEKLGRVNTDGNEITGGKSEYISKDFITISELLNYLKSESKKYDYIIELKTHDINLDQKSINVANNEAKSHYQFLFFNCMDIVEKALKIQGFKTSGAFIPNNAFSDIYRLNFNLLSIGNRQNEIKISNIPSGIIEIGNLEIIQFGDRIVEPQK